jgi:hypothetical protein
MNEQTDAHGHGDDGDGEFEPEYATERTTAPQSPYSMRDVGVGAAIALAGLVVVFAIPVLGTL